MKYDNLLDTPPTTVDEVELADALQVAPASTRSRKVTTMLVALLLVSVGALGGLWWGNRSNTATLAGMPGVRSGHMPSGFPGGFPGGGAAPSASATPGTASSTGGLAVVGTVVKVAGDAVTVKDLGGAEHVVRLAPQSRISRSASITATDLKAGESVTVSGKKSADGSVDATSITAK